MESKLERIEEKDGLTIYRRTGCKIKDIDTYCKGSWRMIWNGFERRARWKTCEATDARDANKEERSIVAI